jgi:hypothetical protein
MQQHAAALYVSSCAHQDFKNKEAEEHHQETQKEKQEYKKVK